MTDFDSMLASYTAGRGFRPNSAAGNTPAEAGERAFAAGSVIGEKLGGLLQTALTGGVGGAGGAASAAGAGGAVKALGAGATSGAVAKAL
jgi:hypothetical protein